jgi:hypothetical protein
MHSYEHVEEEWRAERLSSTTTTTAAAPTTPYQPPRLLGLYPLAAMLNHSCQANAVRVYTAGHVMVVHALENIDKGEEICWSYIPPTRPCPLRQDLLQNQHGFCCICHRCQAEEEASMKVESLAALQDLEDLNQGRLATPVAHWHGRLHRAVRRLEDEILPTAGLSNQVRRYLRISYLYIYIHYFNSALTDLSSEDPLVANILRSDLLTLATQLHFSFCACHNASTEHLSVRCALCLLVYLLLPWVACRHFPTVAFVSHDLLRSRFYTFAMNSPAACMWMRRIPARRCPRYAFGLSN